MKIYFNNENRTIEEIEKRKITIALGNDVEFHVTINKFDELVIQKQQYGDGESSIVIKPSVSNEIRLT